MTAPANTKAQIKRAVKRLIKLKAQRARYRAFGDDHGVAREDKKITKAYKVLVALENQAKATTNKGG